MSAGPILLVLLDGRPIAEIARSNSRLELTYDAAWRADPTAHSISLSMPLSSAVHDERALIPFLWGLLPDNYQIRRHFARAFGVSERSPIALLTHLGADCAGAIQLVPPDAVAAQTKGAPGVNAEWMSESEIAEELRAVMRTGTPSDSQRAAGRFSLAGAQPKIALLQHEGKWGRSTGRTPTTHILKPPSPEFPGIAENEHLCLRIAQALGLETANTTVQRFEGEVAIVVERFDRLWNGTEYRRLHQEDVCQAFGVHPADKYESDGGPGHLDVLRLLAQSSLDAESDRERYIDAAILNWVLAATDAHAKNFGLLHTHGGVRLAPLYDVVSYLPFAEPPLHDVRLAMRVDREYEVRRVALVDWLRLARKAGLEEEFVVARLESVIARVADVAVDEERQALAAGLGRGSIVPLSARIVERARECGEVIRRGSTPQ